MLFSAIFAVSLRALRLKSFVDCVMPCCHSLHRTRILIVVLSLACLVDAHPTLAADQPQWLRISSDHFIVYTDAGEKKGHEVAARFEQMRAMYGTLMGQHKLRMSQPMEIIAFGGDRDFSQVAPLRGGQPIAAPAFWLTGDDRIFVALNLFQPDSWRAVEHQLAHYFLTYNYPPTQPWFDEGFAEYFSSVDFTRTKTELGADPTLNSLSQTDILEDQTQVRGLKSHTEILSAPAWLALPDLFGMKNRTANGQEGTHQTLFYAESWMLVHYLINQNKLAQTGTYFDLVQNQKIPLEQAVQQAYGMTVAQLDKAVKDYFHSLKPLADAMWASKQANPAVTSTVVYELPLPLEVDDVGSSHKQIVPAEAQALVAEMELRIPERRAQAVQQLQQLAGDEKTDSAVAHRALAWAHVQKSETSEAFEELSTAMEMSASDSWVRFGLAEASYHSGEKGARVQGLANTMQSLQVVIDEYPDFAEAYALLGWARLVGGGTNSAIDAMRMAIQLSPRNESYQLRLAQTYLATKKWDEATAVLERLKTSSNPQIAGAAKKELNDMPFLKKFGVRPQEATGHQEVITANTQKHEDISDDADDAEAKPAPKVEPPVDKRPVQFLKATLVSVDCSQPPVAVLTVAEGNKTLKLRTGDYKAAAVIGSGGFSCDWKDIAVNLNYKRGGKMDGDLVSIEVR
jgi:tetratricopeptide (TPR) repeat protein